MLLMEQTTMYHHESSVKIRNPHQRALTSGWMFIALSSLLALLALGLALLGGQRDQILMAPALVGAGVFAILGLALCLTWLLGWRHVRRIRAFLASDRPLLRWRYTAEEWQTIKEAAWQEERSDWQVQLGCLTALFGLIGLLVGVMIGAEEGTGQAIFAGVTGLILGLLVGGVIGAVVASSNHLAIRQEYARPEPGQVALARHELYANDQYFQGDGHASYIRQATLQAGDPAVLQIDLQTTPRSRTSGQEEWLIVVPSRLLQDVKAVIPSLTEEV